MKKRITIIISALSFIAVVSLSMYALSSWGLLQGTPTFSKPSEKSVEGTYTVEKVSWFVPARRKLKDLSLTFSSDGTYQLHGQHDGLSSPLIPELSGKWTLCPNRGMDLGSRERWGICFAPHKQGATQAWLLEVAPPYRIMFTDYSRNSRVGELLIMKKAEQVSGGNGGKGR